MEATIKGVYCHLFTNEVHNGHIRVNVRLQVRIKVGQRIFRSSTRDSHYILDHERGDTPEEEAALIGKWATRAMRDRYLYMQKTLGETLPPMPGYKQWRKESDLSGYEIDDALDEWFMRSQNYLQIGKI